MDFDIKKYAKLARIELSEEEENKFQQDLGEILEHADELRKVNVKNIEPMTGGMTLKNVWREDLPKDDAVRDFEPGFPGQEKGYVKVPRVFEND